MAILQIDQLQKSYGRLRALKKLSLQVEPGQVYGILGPNGSGKTTTLGIVLGIIQKDGGQFQWFDGRYGNNPRKRIGALLETPNFYPYLSAERNLDIVAHIKQIAAPKKTELLQLVDLQERRHSPFRTYSFGMKQRLAIAAAMVGDPDVLILDEPTNGLDPQGIAEIRATILKIAERGKTIIMASHILDEVEKVCSHVAIIKKGNLLASGTVGAILNQDVVIEIAAKDKQRLKELLARHPDISHLEEKGPLLVAQAKQDIQAASLNQMAFEQGIVLTHLLLRPKSLEAEFLEITQKAPNLD
ncbi:MAG: ABC transporter ATP-binding protein [Bacteroidota bacterium]